MKESWGVNFPAGDEIQRVLARIQRTMKEPSMRMKDAIELMKREGAKLAKRVVIEGLPAMEFDCWFANEGVSSQEISAIAPDCPQDIREFWTAARNAQLFKDTTYGQWGLEILDPQHAVQITEHLHQRRKRDFVVGDLVVGRFLGDSDLLLIRCDPSAGDYGSVHVALPIDPRAEWYCVANSFAAFLDLYIKSEGGKYWAIS